MLNRDIFLRSELTRSQFNLTMVKLAFFCLKFGGEIFATVCQEAIQFLKKKCTVRQQVYQNMYAE